MLGLVIGCFSGERRLSGRYGSLRLARSRFEIFRSASNYQIASYVFCSPKVLG